MASRPRWRADQVQRLLLSTSKDLQSTLGGSRRAGSTLSWPASTPTTTNRATPGRHRPPTVSHVRHSSAARMSSRRYQSSSSSAPHQERQSWTARMRHAWRTTPIKWTPLSIAGGATLLVVLNLWKQKHPTGVDLRDGTYDTSRDNMPTVQGPWQVHVIGALPLRTISRIYGALNSYTLPVWFRVPGYKLYSWIFGVNLDEMEQKELSEYRSLSEFFMRSLKPGVRPVADCQLVSPADGRVVNFGYIENRRVEQVKGVSYSVDALLSGVGPNSTDTTDGAPVNGSPSSSASDAENAVVDEKAFANLNGIPYTIDQLMGGEPHENQDTGDGDEGKKPAKKRSWKRLFTWKRSSASSSSPSNGSNSSDKSASPDDSLQSTSETAHDASVPETGPDSTGTSAHSLPEQLKLASQVFDPSSPHWSLRNVPKEGNKMYFCVVYLAPGDYHRFHSPTNWVVERRRHFAGELYSVSPYMTKLLKDLFVLNERVALLGRWRYGFFSECMVGATNVGSIRIHFDEDLRTNSPLRPKVPGEYSEATYTKSSALLQGKPLRAGEEMGGFWLGSTIVLVFEAPEDFMFTVRRGDKVKYGEPLGDRKDKVASLLSTQKQKEMLGQ